MKSRAYNLLAIPVSKLLVLIFKLFNKKLAIREKECRASLQSAINLDKANNRRFWFHAASMGEFEQAKPLIEMIKDRNPQIQVIVSFFSPSGYENQKKYPFADAVVYLPFDSLSNVNYFIDTVKPDVVVFVRYEIWRNYLEQIDLRNIPLFLICATEPSGSLMKIALFKSFTRKNYNFFTKIFTVGKNHTDFFSALGVTCEIETLSDTRYDRIIENVKAGREKQLLQGGLFGEDEFIIVAGSTWKPDEDIIIPAVEKLTGEGMKIRVIYVPHEPTPEHINQLKNRLVNPIVLSDLLNLKSQNRTITEIRNFVSDRHLIVDSIGKLLSLYKYATLAYIGGAFGAGVHSVAEPAGYGIPLVCGAKKYTNSNDSVNLLRTGALTVIENEDAFFHWVKYNYESADKRKAAGKLAKEYIFGNKGATESIYNQLVK